jgi:serine/threonine protein kinase
VNETMIDLEQIGPYRLLGLLGQGRCSSVWRAEDLRDGAVLALKSAPAGPLAERLKREAVLLARLHHPNVLHCSAAGETGGVAWLAMPLLAPWPGLPDLARFRVLLAALAYVHEMGIVHCDLKPSNLLQGPDGTLILADFGLARESGQGPGLAHGTPHAMAPEQMRGEVLDARADVFAAGVLLYAVLTGARPFSGSAFEVMQQVLHAEPAPPSRLSGQVGPAFDTLVARALAKQPAARYPDAGAFLIDFDAACQLGHLR